jgi:hypothetical protein
MVANHWRIAMDFDPTWRAVRAFTLALVLATAGVGLAACDDSGPAEEAGSEAGAAIDDAVEGAGDAMEEAGEAASDAVEDAGDAVEEAGERVEDAAN